MALSFEDLVGGAGAGGAASLSDLAVVATHVAALEQSIELAEEGYADDGSHQTIAADLELAAGAGTSDEGDSSFLGAIMGNLLGAALTKTHNYLGGLIGHYNVTGTKNTTYPSGAVLAGIGDGVTEADGAVVAYIDGDSEQTNAGAAFKVRHNNSTPGSGFDFGLDLQDAAHDGFSAVSFLSAPIRLGSDICIFATATEPVDGTEGDGAGFAGPGSLCIAIDTGFLWSNTNTKASPTWDLTGEQGS